MSTNPSSFRANLSYTLRDGAIIAHAGGEFISRAAVGDITSPRSIDEAICEAIHGLPGTYLDPRRVAADKTLQRLHYRTFAPFDDHIMDSFDLDDGLFGLVVEIRVGVSTRWVRCWYESAIGSRMRSCYEIINPATKTVIVPRLTSMPEAIYAAYGLAWAAAMLESDH